jgi:hypothetical protein
MFLTGARLTEQGLDPHASHESTYPVPANVRIAQSVELVAQLPRAHERVFQMQAVYVTHEFQILRADWSGQVIDAAATDTRQLGLLLDG